MNGDFRERLILFEHGNMHLFADLIKYLFLPDIDLKHFLALCFGL